MGVEGLSKLLRDNKVLKDHLEDLRGLTVGVDGFVLLHRIILNKACAREFHQKPPVDLYGHVSFTFKDRLMIALVVLVIIFHLGDLFR